MSIYERYHMECDDCEAELPLTIQVYGAVAQRDEFRAMAKRDGWTSVCGKRVVAVYDYCPECSRRRSAAE